MTSARLTRFLAGFFILLLALSIANVAVSQVPTIKRPGKYKSPMQFLENVSASSTNQVYTVPDNRTLVITDIFVANIDSSAVINQKIIKDGDNANAISIAVPAQSTFSHSFSQGLEFPPGSLIEVQNPAGSTTVFTLVGYEFKEK